jgi:hypothetical protein
MTREKRAKRGDGDGGLRGEGEQKTKEMLIDFDAVSKHNSE